MGGACSRRGVIVGAVASVTAFPFTRTKAKAAEPVVHEVRIKAFAFEPEQLEVSVGDIISWINEDLAPHTATATEFGWDTGEITSAASGKIVVLAGMETTYFCAFHPNMKGRFVIR